MLSLGLSSCCTSGAANSPNRVFLEMFEASSGILSFDLSFETRAVTPRTSARPSRQGMITEKSEREKKKRITADAKGATDDRTSAKPLKLGTMNKGPPHSMVGITWSMNVDL